MYIADIIQKAENRYRQALENYFLETWGNTKLYSHGIGHHRRVWYYASRLLAEPKVEESGSNQLFAEKLIIACYLHDLGMAIDTGISHGKHSMELCRKFLEIRGLDESEYTDVLEAVEYHDNKEYTGSAGKIDLPTLLNIADDLDAFGYIGVYRYLEIYLIRGVPESEIAHRIRGNATKRFLNFSSVFQESTALVEKHRKRYQILDLFFRQMENEVNNKSQDNKELSDNLRIVDLAGIINLNINPENIYKSDILQQNAQALNSFLGSLIRETEEFKC